MMPDTKPWRTQSTCRSSAGNRQLPAAGKRLHNESIQAFYDDLADYYHLIFQDWEESIERQASILGPLIERELPPGQVRILDCACGIGTQSLGLAARGHVVVGSDFSRGAIARARREAQERNLSIQFEVADMRDLSEVTESAFDVVIAFDNALPHLLGEDGLAQAVHQITAKLRPGGLFLASIRDYDQIIVSRPSAQPPAFFSCNEHRRIYHQVWDWTTDRLYTAHLYITQETSTGWDTRHFAVSCRAVLRKELAVFLDQAGYREVRWFMPADTGFYQPLLLARY